ncbi:helix-turn-helix domain-containing protein [Mucilaginibacter sp. 14171R-50]|uniref:helix-turn-helix domain-containing protein n=1 Tax=Mucilaginibacter sp. 14171R-50 TaxID=2703789 RepID=UPI00138B9890|nr:helix-turn-helix domain-containing protein [Mucilaginibacter sp. 14171R-50]QHS55858.1 helix-turn-helix domain-containing protein [Mucilaginibacter sp. 14171R-50]
MELQVLTTEDLEKFRKQLLTDIENLLNVKYPKKWLKTNEVMDLLGMSEVTLQTLRNKGKIPFRKLGGTVYFNAEELDQYIQQLGE